MKTLRTAAVTVAILAFASMVFAAFEMNGNALRVTMTAGVAFVVGASFLDVRNRPERYSTKASKMVRIVLSLLIPLIIWSEFAPDPGGYRGHRFLPVWIAALCMIDVLGRAKLGRRSATRRP